MSVSLAKTAPLIVGDEYMSLLTSQLTALINEDAIEISHIAPDAHLDDIEFDCN